MLEADFSAKHDQLVGPILHPDGTFFVRGGIPGSVAVRIIPPFVAYREKRVGRETVHGVVENAARPYDAGFRWKEPVLIGNTARWRFCGVIGPHELSLEGGPPFVVELVGIALNALLKIVEAKGAIVERIHPNVKRIMSSRSDILDHD